MGSVMREITSPTNRLVYKINENDEILTITIAINKTNDLKNINVNKGTIICSIEELEDEIKLFNFIKKFFEIIKMTYKINPNTQFNFIINTKEEEQKLTNIANFLNQNNIKCYIVETEDYKKQKQLQTNQVEEIKEEQKEVLATGSKEIVKQGLNGEILKYVESNGKIYDNNFNMSINEQKQRLLNEWLKDPVKSNQISKMTKEQLDMELTRIVTLNQKQYDLKSASQTNQQNNNQANIANNISKQEDGKVNTELGIVQNGVNNSNQFAVVEQNNNGYNIVTPTTTEQTISSNTGINTTTSTSNNSSNIDNNSQLLSNELDTRDVLNNIYYIDEYSKEIYNSNGELIGTLGSIYYIDMNNHLVKNNEVIGIIENIKDMPHAKTIAKKRALEKPNGYISFLLFSIIISLALVIYIVIKLT